MKIVSLLLIILLFVGMMLLFSMNFNLAFANISPPKIVYDSNGVPLVYYGNATGYQRNPVTTSFNLMYYCDSYIQTKNLTKLQYLKNSANWLIDNSQNYGNYSLLEFKFPFTYNLSPPWHSAMAQGLAIQALTKAYKITDNATYLDATMPLLNSFYVDVKDGGVTEKTENSGWWYEEYAGNGSKNPRVLNGMMYVMIALHDYYNYTHDTKANFLFNQGVVALKNNIANYDNNGSSYYDSQRTTAPSFYQKVHIDLLDQLYKITGEPIFKKYHDKWDLYVKSRERPSVIPEFDSMYGIVIVASISGAIIISKRCRFFP